MNVIFYFTSSIFHLLKSPASVFSDKMTSITLQDSRKLSYALDKEPNDAPIVLLANPLCTPFTVWDHAASALRKNGFRTLRFDQPGHGGSSAPKPEENTFASMANDVHALLEALGITKLHAWVGVSMGAAMGFYFVTQYPQVVIKFVICDTITCSPVNAGIEDAFGPRVEAAREDGSMEKTVQQTLERWFGKEFLEANSEEAQRVRNLMLQTKFEGFEACCRALSSRTFDLRPLFGRVGASVDDAICIVGEKDANLPQTMEEMRQEVEKGFEAAGKPNKVGLVTIRNAGHVCFVDGLDQFVEVVTPFLKN
jgi:pimeloyl-ACP methyl ester carboxylesterase